MVNDTLHHVEQQPHTCEKSYPVTMHFEQGSLKGLEMLVVAVVALRHSAGESNLPSTAKAARARQKKTPLFASLNVKIQKSKNDCIFLLIENWLGMKE